jgi:putative ABC transport system ATP-binding protein
MSNFRCYYRISPDVNGMSEYQQHLIRLVSPRQLSGGQEQRVAIARAIVTEPTILLADEPTGDLDRESATAVMELLSRLNRELGRTIVMVTHDPRTTEWAKTVLHLEKGQLVEHAPQGAQ